MGQIRWKVPPDLHRWLKARAAEAGMSLGDYVVMLLENARRKEKQ